MSETRRERESEREKVGQHLGQPNPFIIVSHSPIVDQTAEDGRDGELQLGGSNLGCKRGQVVDVGHDVEGVLAGPPIMREADSHSITCHVTDDSGQHRLDRTAI